MSNIRLHRNTHDIVSKIRRMGNSDSLARTIGIIINDDGSVFDMKIKKQYTSIVEWSKEYQNAL